MSNILLIKYEDMTATCVVKPEFFEICPIPERYDFKTLLKTYNLAKYLHNEEGPAVVDNRGASTYWLNGKAYADVKQWQDALVKLKFSQNLERIINDEQK